MLRNHMGELSKQLRTFMQVQQFQQDVSTQYQLLIQSYLDRGKTDWFLKVSAEWERLILAQETPLSSMDHLHLFLINEQRYHQAGTFYRQDYTSKTLDAAEQALDHFYWLSKLRIQYEKLARKQQFNQMHNPNLHLEDIPDHLDLPVLEIYRQQIEHMLQAGNQEAQFQQMRSLYLSSYGSYPLRDQRILLYALVNYTSSLFRQGKSEYLRDAFELYQFGLQSKLLIVQEQLTETTYSNLVTLGCSLKEFEFVASFIQHYSSKLPPAIQEDALIWSGAKIQFHQGAFQACIDALKDRRFKLKTFVYRTKTLLLQAYFEHFQRDPSYISLLDNFYDSFGQKLRKEPHLSKKRVQALLKLSAYIKQLALWIEKGKSLAELEAIQSKVQQESNIQGVNWLNQKIKDLQAKKTGR